MESVCSSNPSLINNAQVSSHSLWLNQLMFAIYLFFYLTHVFKATHHSFSLMIPKMTQQSSLDKSRNEFGWIEVQQSMPKKTYGAHMRGHGHVRGVLCS